MGILRPRKDGGCSVCKASDENVGKRRCCHILDTMSVKGRQVCEELRKNGYEAFFVGGCVRDLFLGKTPKDVDITTNALPSDVQKIFPHHIDTGLQHGTVTVTLDEHFTEQNGFEVTTYRVDGDYSDGRHPDKVDFTSNITEDLGRRDFTINAIAYDPSTNTLVDPYDGQLDINNKIIRAVGNPKERFMEDPLRVMRAIRFATKYDFQIEENTDNAMHDTEVLEKLRTCISKERITDELRKTLVSGKPIKETFGKHRDIIAVCIPEITPCFDCTQNDWHRHDVYEHTLSVVDLCESNDFSIKMAALLHDIGKPHCVSYDEQGIKHFYGHPDISEKIAEDVSSRDMVIPTKEKEMILKLVKYHDTPLKANTKYIKRLVSQEGEEFTRNLLVLKYADLRDHKAPKGKEARLQEVYDTVDWISDNLDETIKQASALKVSDLALNGNDIMKMFNLKPCKEVGEKLNKCFEAVLDERVENTPEALKNYLLSSI